MRALHAEGNKIEIKISISWFECVLCTRKGLRLKLRFNLLDLGARQNGQIGAEG